MKRILILFVSMLTLLSCKPMTKQDSVIEPSSKTRMDVFAKDTVPEMVFDTTTKTIHIIVALCDNKNQGIVPVPEKIGNGQDPKNNLYWGALYGMKSYFKKSKDWTFIHSVEVNDTILERIVLKHKKSDFYLVADAYDGRRIKEATEIFLRSSAGLTKKVLPLEKDNIGIEGNAKLLGYIGHDGLMDFTLQEKFINEDGVKRDLIILACYSRDFFKPHLEKANTNGLLWTTGLMAPEAYTIHDALIGYINKESNDQIRLRGAQAYAKYQKCSLKAAKNLLITN